MRDALSANEPSSSCYPTSNASEESVTLPHEQWYNGCPVAPLDVLQVDAQLGLISVGEVEASFVRCLVAFNDAQLADDETLHINLGNARQVLCRLPLLFAAAAKGEPSRVKVRSAGLASAVAWMLRGCPGEVHLMVLAHTGSASCGRSQALSDADFSV